MEYADDLLRLARVTALHNGDSQAAQRRSVSTAYYALFHLLVSAATMNWARTELRPELGRLFQHARMKDASNKIHAEIHQQLNSKDLPAGERATLAILGKVATTFVEIQQKREEADYNTARTWTLTEVLGHVDEVEAAFRSWRTISHEARSQGFLLSLLGRR